MDLVTKAKQRFAAKDIFWKNALAQNLENKQYGLSVHWAALCLGLLMDSHYPEQMAALLPEIKAARRFLHQKPVDVDLIEIAHKIWCRTQRDAPQTALSLLYKALHDYYTGANCVQSACAVVSNLFCADWPNGSDWHAQSDRMFAIVLKSHDDVLKRKAGSEPHGA